MYPLVLCNVFLHFVCVSCCVYDVLCFMCKSLDGPKRRRRLSTTKLRAQHVRALGILESTHMLSASPLGRFACLPWRARQSGCVCFAGAGPPAFCLFTLHRESRPFLGPARPIFYTISVIANLMGMTVLSPRSKDPCIAVQRQLAAMAGS